MVGTMGVALTVCTMPGQNTYDRLGPGKMELGLGIVSTYFICWIFPLLCLSKLARTILVMAISKLCGMEIIAVMVVFLSSLRNLCWFISVFSGLFWKLTVFEIIFAFAAWWTRSYCSWFTACRCCCRSHLEANLISGMPLIFLFWFGSVWRYADS